MVVIFRRNALVLITAVICCVPVLYQIFLSDHANYGRLNFPVKDGASIPQSRLLTYNKPNLRAKEGLGLPQSRLVVATTLKPVFLSKKPKTKTTSTVSETATRNEQNFASKERGLGTSSLELHTLTSPAAATRNAETKGELKKLSTTWPIVHIADCSRIDYMNRGINSRYQAEARDYPRTGIISFPGSGNTWTRHLIQQATGLWTGSSYHDRSLYRGGFLAELDDCEDKGTVVVKAHYPLPEGQSYCKFERAVLVMRDPYRAVLSEFNWRTTSKHTGVADPRLFKNKLWMEHVIKRTHKWMSTSKKWIERFHHGTDHVGASHQNPYTKSPAYSKTLLMVSYERMRENPTRELRRVVSFLGLPTFRKHCLKVDQEGNFRREYTRSESIECLFQNFNLSAIVDSRINALSRRTIEIGLGDITAEFEGPGGDVRSAKCQHL